MDELDTALLTLLQEDAGLTNKELATRLNTAQSTCLERVRRLTRQGVLRGRRAEVDLRRIGRPVQAMVAVRLRPPNRSVIESFTKFVETLPEVLSVFVMSGDDDFLLHIAVTDNDHLNSFVLDRLTERREIVNVRTSIIFSHTQRTVVLPCPQDPS
ncbi:Lrp/AsnC family transcriptional regulator [Saccharopolyspora elongata]|uniref:Lrp/AsnC family transcriptional regulator n=1 Tax=Saccharopolyspora elongata TaxID=2530387 RepID=A0A4V2YK28_9PSEU|nr:Lrp/AsnC family transcriptional regulator [Saccharopolyspora elongata]TDD41037.1 Lrp/AsnC family transcriptional regulator [Saccharopolyspora elongata]